MKPYEVIDHTADIGIRVRGEELKELFANAVYAFFDLSWDLSQVEEKLKYTIKIEEEGYTELLVGFLRELLYLNAAEDLLFRRFEIVALDEGHLEASCFGERLDHSRHRILLEFKAVTYHKALVVEVDGGWEGQIIFDI